MSGMRQKDQSDWDLERCFDLFDEALTSKDERVINALRNLLMITALTAPEGRIGDVAGILESRKGPLRRLQNDYNDMFRQINRLNNEMTEIKHMLHKSNALEASKNNWPYIGGGYGDGYVSGGDAGRITGGLGFGGLAPDITAQMKNHTKNHVTQADILSGLKDEDKL
jgi:hypothetical protein